MTRSISILFLICCLALMVGCVSQSPVQGPQSAAQKPEVRSQKPEIQTNSLAMLMPPVVQQSEIRIQKSVIVSKPPMPARTNIVLVMEWHRPTVSIISTTNLLLPRSQWQTRFQTNLPLEFVVSNSFPTTNPVEFFGWKINS